VRSPSSRAWRASRSFAAPLALAGAFLLTWEGIVHAWEVPPWLLPPPSRVAVTLWEDAPLLAAQGSVTALEWAVGLALSVVCAFVVCVACYASRMVRDVMRSVLVASQAIPYLTFAPLLLLWFGLGLTPKIVLVVLTCTFPIAAVWLDALLAARAEYEAVCAMLKMGRVRSFVSVSLPASLHGFFSGLRVSVSYAVVSATMSELIGSEAGLGVYIVRAQATYRTDRVMAAVILVVIASLLSTRIVDIVRARVVFWRPQAR
jgi:putative hydroxymethylpyrimidine transport system permease protein